jgi:uncharacterized membrane protein
MPVDVSSTIDIDRPRHEVAAFAADTDNAPRWYTNIKEAARRSSGPLVAGSQIDFVAEFLGRRLVYTYEVKELVPGERVVMATADGPFPMRTTYTWADAPGGGTRMELRNEGQPAGFKSVAVPFLSLAMKRENRKDLRRLKQLLEAQ